MNVGAAANRLDAAANVFEERMVGVFEPVVDPPPIAVFFDQARALHQLQVSAGVRLRHVQCIHELADAQAFLDCQEAAGDPQTEAVAQRTK